MKRSEQVAELMLALAKAQAEFTVASKDSRNSFFNSNYADLASVIGSVRPALNKHGIALVSFIESDIEQQRARATVALYHGEQFLSITIEAPATGKARDNSDKFDVQTLGAAWTYLRRYGVQSLCGIATDEDDDANLLGEQQRQQQRQQPTPQARPSLRETLSTSRLPPQAHAAGAAQPRPTAATGVQVADSK